MTTGVPLSVLLLTVAPSRLVSAKVGATLPTETSAGMPSSAPPAHESIIKPATHRSDLMANDLILMLLQTRLRRRASSLPCPTFPSQPPFGLQLLDQVRTR